MESINLSGFTRVDMRGAFGFEVTKSDVYSVAIDRDWLKYPRAYVRGETLVVEDPWYDVARWFTPWIVPRVTVQMPELRQLRVSGSCKGSATGFRSTADFALRVSGASQVTGEFVAGNADYDIAGASRIELAGSAKDLRFRVAGASRIIGTMTAEKGKIDVAGASRIGLKGSLGEAVVNIAGASRLDMRDFTIGNASFKIAGASQCLVNVEGRLDAELAGASKLEYGGTPQMGNIKSIGASTLTRR